MSENETQQYALMLQQYQQQAEYLQENLAQIQMSIQGLNEAVMALEALGKNDGGQEVLVPVGVGTFIFSEVKDTNRVLVGVGSGVSIEQDRETSIKTLNSRRDELEDVMKKASESYTNIVSQMEQLQAKLQTMMPQQ